LGAALIAARIQAEPVAEADGCEEEGTDACLINVLLPEDGTYIVEATTATPGETGDYTLEIAGPRDPFGAGLLRQFQTDGVTPVLEGGNVSGMEVLITALVTDLDEFDSLLVEVEVKPVGVAFDSTGTATGSSLVANGDTASVLVGGLVDDTEYHWRARAVDYTGRAGPWVSFGSNTDPDDADFRTVVSDLPRAPTGLDQLLSNGTSIAVGGITSESIVDFRATVSDPDGDNVQLQVELRPVGEDFAGTPDAIASSAPFASGTTITLPVPVSDRTDYHWRARAVDANGLEGPWVAFGGNADSPLPAEIDFSVLIPDAPDAPTGLTQLRSDAITAIGVGETTDENIVVFSATVTDPDPGDLVLLVIEVLPIGEAFTGNTIIQSPLVPSGSAPTIARGGLLDDTAYHWRAQARDESGLAVSPWVTFGGNADSPLPADTDFAIVVPATQLAFTGQPPASVGAGATFSVEVSAREPSGLVDTAYNGDISIAFDTDPSGGAATLSGTLTRTAVNGVATFDDLSVDVTGTGYILLATSVPLSERVSNAFDVAASSVDPDLSLVVANPTSISSVDGVATITVTALDGLGNPVTGATVELSATGSGNTLTQPAATTDVNGEATGTLGSTVAEIKTVSATVGGVGITQTATVTVTVGPVSAEQSTVSALPTSISTDGETSTITVTALDANGNPIQGTMVVLAATGTGNTVTQPAAPTDANGQATGTLSSTVPENKTVSATIDGLAITQTATVTVTTGGVSASQSTVSASPTSISAAGGSSTITVTARDASGNPIQGATVTLAATGTGNTLTQPATPTDANGQTTGTLSSTDAGDKVVMATVGTTTITQTATVTVTAGEVDGGQSGVAANPTSITADGQTSTITVTARDQFGNPVEGATVVLAATGSENTLTQPGAPTGPNGEASGTLSSTLAEAKTVSAIIDGTAVTQTVSVTVTPGAASAAQTTGLVPEGTAGDPTVIIVTTRDANGNALTTGGETVAVNVTGANTATPPVTDNGNGTYTASYTPTVVGIDNVAITLNGLPISGSPYSSTVSTLNGVQLAVAIQPSRFAQNTVPFIQQPVVQLQDEFGNDVSQAGVNVTATIFSGGGTLNGTRTIATDVTGAARFADLAITGTVGDRTLIFTAGGFVSAESDLITITPGPADAGLSSLSASPTSITAGSGSSTITVTARDVSGNLVQGAAVTLFATGSGNTVTQPSGPTNASGVATGTLFSTVAESKTVSATIDGVLITQTATVTVTPGGVSASQSTVSASPPSISADGGVSTITVTARDANRNAIPGDTVTLSATGSGNTLTQPSGPTNASGVATGTLSSTVAQTKTVSARINGVLINQTATVTVTPGAASQLTITTQPAAPLGTAQSGVAFGRQPVVQLRDAQGNAVSRGGVVITATFATTPGGTPSLTNATATTNLSGVATFSGLAITGLVGNYTLWFGGTGLTPAVSNAINLTAGSASQLTITTQPSVSAQSGVPFSQQPVVQLRDAAGNPVSQALVNVTATIASGGGTLGGVTTVTTSGSGVATFTNLSITGLAGNRTLQFTSGLLTSVVSTPITITAGAASQLTITTQPSATAQSGVAFSQQPRVQLRDAAGNAVSQSGVNVTAAIASGGGSLGGVTTVQTNASGLATFTNLSITGLVGIRTLRFTSGVLTPAVSSGISITAGAATRLTITTQPSASAQSGQVFPQQPRIQLRDAAGNPVSQFGVNVTAVIASGGGTLGGVTTVATNASGLATFANLSITGTAGNRTLRFTSGVLTPVVSNAINITAGSASQLTITTQPAAPLGTAQSGVALIAQPVVQLRDGAGNPVSHAGVVITATFASTPGGTPSLTNATATTNGSGVATFSGLAITGMVGDYTLRFASGALTPAVSNTVTLSAGAVSAAQSTVSATPTSIVASSGAVTSTITVTARDASGNPVPGATVSLTATGTGNALTQPSGPTNGSGVATGTLSSTDAGPKVVTATADGTTITQTTTVTVTAGAVSASQSTVTADPTSIPADGTSSTITVTARDQFDNPVPGVTVTLTANPTTGNTLTQPSGPTNASGVATGTLSSTEAGDKVVSAMAGGISITQTATVTVTAGAVSASQSTVTASPTSIQASAGAVISTITVTARDANNNPIQGATVTLTATGSGNTLTQPTLPTDVNGQRTGTLSSTATADKVVSATAGGTPITQTATVTVTAGAATKLAFTEQPSNTTAGATISPPVQVTVQDQFDNTVTGFTGNVRVRIGTNPGGGTLGGTTMVGAVGGVATFGDLAIDKAANGYTLETTSGSLTLDTSNPFNITVGSASQVTITQQPSASAQSGQVFPQQPVVLVEDASGNPVSEPVVLVEDASGNPVSGVNVTGGIASGAPALGGTVTVATNGSGVAAFTNLAITGAVGIRTLDFTVGALTPVVSDPINITDRHPSQCGDCSPGSGDGSR
jgi:adhesin/invasin